MIAVDAMGGDYAPYEVVCGAVAAARQGIPVLLCGNRPLLAQLLNQIDTDWSSLAIQIEPSSTVITMRDEPTRAVIKKQNSSLVKGLHAVVKKRAQAFVSAGNSGAVLVGSTLVLGRVPGIYRPALASFLPTKTGSLLCLDLGANVDCKPAYLEQFALMGHLFVQQQKGIREPRIGLLSNGEEPYKGPLLNKKAFVGLAAMPNIRFVGNIEPHQIFDGQIDLLVCDGFTGNILLKTLQGAASLMFDLIKQEAKQSWLQSLLFFLNKRLFKRLHQRANYASVGGGLLLGAQYPVVIAHGRSRANAIERAICYAHQLVQDEVCTKFNAAFAKTVSTTAGASYARKDKLHSDASRR